MKNRYLEMQKDIISRYNFILTTCECSKNIHVHIRERMVCNWESVNTAMSTFNLLYEIGCIETYNDKLSDCERAYIAVIWAIKHYEEYGLSITYRTRKKYQDLIFRKYTGDIGRNIKLPPIEHFKLFK